MAPVTHYSQLIVWKLAEEIRIKVFELTAKPLFAEDFKAKRQGEDAANSVCRNIAEGFGCETHAEFARFLEISRRSLNEVHDVLHGAQLKEYVTASELAPVRRLSNRIYPAFSRLMAYLRSTPTPRRSGTRTGRTDKNHGRTDKRQDRPTRISDRTPTSVRIAPTRISDRTDKRQDRTNEYQ